MSFCRTSKHKAQPIFRLGHAILGCCQSRMKIRNNCFKKRDRKHKLKKYIIEIVKEPAKTVGLRKIETEQLVKTSEGVSHEGNIKVWSIFMQMQSCTFAIVLVCCNL